MEKISSNISECCDSNCCTKDPNEDVEENITKGQKTPEELKQIVKEKYGQIANEKESCGCGCGCSASDKNSFIMKDDYLKIDGYISNADLGLGCGLPTEYAEIKNGNIVVDLGSGAGNDVFIVKKIVGEKGRVIGIDFSPEMIAKANNNLKKLGYNNIEFYLAEIENLPLENNLADVVISNCVLNLVPNKEKAFSEINRILKPGRHFCISDIVINGNIPEKIKHSAEMYAGCVSGAIQLQEYLNIISDSGFHNVQIKKIKEINIPAKIWKKYLSDREISEFQYNNAGIFSITVTGEK